MLIFAMCDGGAIPVVRSLPTSSVPAEAAMDLLLAGTTEAEQTAGFFVGFDWVDTAERALIDVGVRIDGGVAYVTYEVDGDPWDPGALAGTSGQLEAFLSPIQGTLFQFPEVDAVELGALCWGELSCGGSNPISREQWESQTQG